MSAPRHRGRKAEGPARRQLFGGKLQPGDPSYPSRAVVSDAKQDAPHGEVQNQLQASQRDDEVDEGPGSGRESVREHGPVPFGASPRGANWRIRQSPAAAL